MRLSRAHNAEPHTSDLINSREYIGKQLKYLFELRDNSWKSNTKFSVAPMMDWTDKHCRLRSIPWSGLVQVDAPDGARNRASEAAAGDASSPRAHRGMGELPFWYQTQPQRHVASPRTICNLPRSLHLRHVTDPIQP
jgi:hypothetical protein